MIGRESVSIVAKALSDYRKEESLPMYNPRDARDAATRARGAASEVIITSERTAAEASAERKAKAPHMNVGGKNTANNEIITQTVPHYAGRTRSGN